MTRNIRFRGKDVKTGEWCYGYYVQQHMPDFDNDIPNRVTGYTTLSMLFNDNPDEGRDGSYWTEVDPKTVGQFTGLQDKDGENIYEGDIVIIPRTPEKKQKRVPTRHVATSHSVCGWVFKSLAKEVISLSMDGHGSFDSYKFEIVGNIYDNPELAQEYSLNLPKPKPRRKPIRGLQVEFLVKDDPKAEPYVAERSKHGARIVFEGTQAEIDKAIQAVIAKKKADAEKTNS